MINKKSASAFDSIEVLLGSKKTEEQEIEESRRALFESLSNHQIESLTGYGYISVEAQDGRAYIIWVDMGLITTSDARNWGRREDWYLRIRGVNKWDELAIKKGWLERAPKEILKAAKKITLDRAPDKAAGADRYVVGPVFRDGSVGRSDAWRQWIQAELEHRFNAPVLITIDPDPGSTRYWVRAEVGGVSARAVLDMSMVDDCDDQRDWAYLASLLSDRIEKQRDRGGREHSRTTLWEHEAKIRLTGESKP